MVKIRIPTPLRRFAQEQSAIEVPAATVGEAMQALVARHHALRAHLYDDQGHLRNFVNLYLNETDVRRLQREETPVKDSDSLVIVPSIAGGAPAMTSGRCQWNPRRSRRRI